MNEKNKKKLQAISILLTWIGLIGLIISIAILIQKYLGIIFLFIFVFVILLSLGKIADKYLK